MGPVAGARVPFAHPGHSHPGFPGNTGFAVSSTTNHTTGSNPAMNSYSHQLMMAAKAGEQISDLYRRRDSGYTHHVSNSNYHHIPQATAAPQVQQSRGAQQQQSLQRSSSRSLSSYLQGNQGNPGPSSSPVIVSTGSSSNSLSKPKSKPRGLMAPPAGKDLSTTLFVDCSIEYELPNAPKIPKNSAPILMVHPGYKPQRVTPRVVQPAAAKPKAVPVAVSQPMCDGHRGGVCHCRPATSTNNATPQKRGGVKRSYATAGLENEFYKHLNQPQPHPQQSAAHAYFDTTSNTSTSALEAYAAAKRSRLQMAENQKQLFNQQQQLFQQQQQQQAQMLRHYQQTYYNRQQQQQQQTTQQQIKQQTDLRISSFQQITPPESLAFWQQQQQLTAAQHQQQMSAACRSGCCGPATHVPGTQTAQTALNQRYAVNKYSPTCPAAPVCCYTLPPTPIVTSNPTANPFCLGCAQGKCQQMAAAANAAAAKKVNMGIMRSL